MNLNQCYNKNDLSDLKARLEDFDSSCLTGLQKEFPRNKKFPSSKHIRTVYFPKESSDGDIIIKKFNPAYDVEEFLERFDVDYDNTIVFELSEEVSLSQLEILTRLIIPITLGEVYGGEAWRRHVLNGMPYSETFKMLIFDFIGYRNN